MSLLGKHEQRSSTRMGTICPPLWWQNELQDCIINAIRPGSLCTFVAGHLALDNKRHFPLWPGFQSIFPLKWSALMLIKTHFWVFCMPDTHFSIQTSLSWCLMLSMKRMPRHWQRQQRWWCWQCQVPHIWHISDPVKDLRAFSAFSPKTLRGRTLTLPLCNWKPDAWGPISDSRS